MQLATPLTLENSFVRLEPLALDHAADLAVAAEGLESAWYTSVPRPDEVEAEIGRRLELSASGWMNPFAVRRLDTGRAVGMTTFCDIDQPNRHVEVGYTWIARDAQGTAVNPAAKLLLLAHAFEACDAIAVELRTHFHNRQSRAAIERLGAKQDGILRNQRIGPDGSLRDTVVFSILPHEWPTVRRGLEARLERFA
ncbi:GNAT family N-acetyltransferase [Microbacterium terricola]|uniref:GCN5 family N-acetyltransferase n=1 Tax=Microbacterium terricola TaxID=344163 RepID=A0ABM8DWM4_9MICO|nr:GNAT family protein [Microbacterium terricola]UYK39274.1 GNAT family N-acetyltransferase [Microbacterium terricola]BDV30005.1 GCN5 family N-acetyltransferase [Microbacterium terricola]